MTIAGIVVFLVLLVMATGAAAIAVQARRALVRHQAAPALPAADQLGADDWIQVFREVVVASEGSVPASLAPLLEDPAAVRAKARLLEDAEAKAARIVAEAEDQAGALAEERRARATIEAKLEAMEARLARLSGAALSEARAVRADLARRSRLGAVEQTPVPAARVQHCLSRMGLPCAPASSIRTVNFILNVLWLHDGSCHAIPSHLRSEFASALVMYLESIGLVADAALVAERARLPQRRLLWTPDDER